MISPVVGPCSPDGTQSHHYPTQDDLLFGRRGRLETRQPGHLALDDKALHLCQSGRESVGEPGVGARGKRGAQDGQRRARVKRMVQVMAFDDGEDALFSVGCDRRIEQPPADPGQSARQCGSPPLPAGEDSDHGRVEALPSCQRHGSLNGGLAPARQSQQGVALRSGETLSLWGTRLEDAAPGDGGDRRVGANHEAVATARDDGLFEPQLCERGLARHDFAAAEERDPGHRLDGADVDADALARLEAPSAVVQSGQLHGEHHGRRPAGVRDQDRRRARPFPFAPTPR